MSVEIITRHQRKTEAAINYGKNAVKKGEDSMSNFMELAPKIAIVEKTYPATNHEDMNLGIDAWVRFKPDQKIKVLPIQIKSSLIGVQTFKEENAFKKMHELIIVLN